MPFISCWRLVQVLHDQCLWSSISWWCPKTLYNSDSPLHLSRTFRTFIFVGMGAFSETSDEKRIHVSINSQQVDTGAQLDASLQTPLDRSESLRIRWVCARRTLRSCKAHNFERRRKIDRYILPLMCSKCPNHCWLMALEECSPSIVLVPPSLGPLSTMDIW
jgi:hypothetical protein